MACWDRVEEWRMTTDYVRVLSKRVMYISFLLLL